MEEVRRINNKGQVVCVIKFDGIEYRRYPNGKHANYYYHKWKENGKNKTKMLHHAIFEKANGFTIPDGLVIHHKDFNPLNNDISNLVMLTAAEHMRIHNNLPKWIANHPEEHHKKVYSKENWHKRREKVLADLAAERRVCEWCGAEYTPTNTHQRFCGKRCHHQWQYKATENNVPMVCQWCGKTFEGNKYLKPKCCSDECAHNLSATKRTNRGRV